MVCVLKRRVFLFPRREQGGDGAVFLNIGCLVVLRHEKNGCAVFLNTGCLLVARRE